MLHLVHIWPWEYFSRVTPDKNWNLYPYNLESQCLISATAQLPVVYLGSPRVHPLVKLRNDRFSGGVHVYIVPSSAVGYKNAKLRSPLQISQGYERLAMF